MKKYLLLLLLLIFMGTSFSVVSANETGHREFESIEIPEGSDVYLLKYTSYGTKKKNLDNVSWKFFGWSVYTKNKNVGVKYKKPDIFARSNMTSNVVKYDYTFTDVTTIETSIELDASLKKSASIKKDGITVGLDQAIRTNIGAAIEKTHTEQLKYTITVNPFTKVTMSIKGDAELSNGGAKNFFFGICIGKGNWEYIDVLNEYYELYEEKLL